MTVEGATIQVNQSIDAAAAGDAGVISGLISCLLCSSSISACCYSPITTWWKNLEELTKIRISVVVSLLLGSWDNIFDWLVCIEWYSTGNPWWATGVLFSIIFAGAFPAFTLVTEDGNYLGVLHICGLGIYLDAVQVLMKSEVRGFDHKQGPSPEFLTFMWARAFEIFMESMVAGSLQMYVAIKMYIVHEKTSSPLEILSIIGSILSIGYGIVTSPMLSQGINATTLDVCLSGIFVSADFVFRTLSMSLFIISLGNVLKWFLLPLSVFVYCIAIRIFVSCVRTEEFDLVMWITPLLAVGNIVTSLSWPGLCFSMMKSRPSLLLLVSEFIVRLLCVLVGIYYILKVEDSYTWLHVLCVFSGIISALLFCFLAPRLYWRSQPKGVAVE